MAPNSTVTGLLNNGVNDTFQTGDVINGNNTSSVNVTVAAAGGNPLVAVNNMGTVVFTNLAGANQNVNAQLFNRVGTVANSGSNNASTITLANAALASTYAVRNTIAGSSDGITVGVRAGDITGATDTINFSVAAAGSNLNNTITRSALVSTTARIEGIAISTAGTNYFTVAGNTTAATDSATLTLTGAGVNDVQIDAGALAATSNFNGSALTGNLTLNFTTNLTSNDTISAGSGTADVLRVQTTQTANGVNVSGFETLRVSEGSVGTILFAAAPNFSTIRVDGNSTNGASTTNAIFNNVGAPATILYRGDSSRTAANLANAEQFGALTLNTSFTGTSNAVAVNLNNGGVAKNAGVGYTVGALTANGVETINYKVADVSATGGSTLGVITSNTLQNISFTTPGTLRLAEDGIVGNATAATATIIGINFSGVTGAVDVVGNAGVNVLLASGAVITAGNGGTTLVLDGAQATGSYSFIGGTGADIITMDFGGNATNSIDGGAGDDSLTGGAGIDFINGGDGADTIVATAGNDVITGGAGDDNLQFTTALLAGNSATTATYNGNAGLNTVTITDAGTTVVDADFRGVSNVQRLQIANGTNTVVLGNLAAAAGFTTVLGGTGADTVTLSDSITNFIGGGGADVVGIVATYRTGLTTTNTEDYTINATTQLAGAARWDLNASATLADVIAGGDWFLAAGVLSFYNGATVSNIQLTANAITTAANGIFTVDIAA